MRIHTAQTLDDIRHVAELAQGETWEHARKFLAAAPTDRFADHLRWHEEDGRPVAGVQVFLHQYPIGRARVGMCLPEHPFVPRALRGRGHFRRLMADLFAWMVQAGYPMAYSHGRKGLYTGIGFAPCFHHCSVLVRIADAVRLQAGRRAEAIAEAQVEAHLDLFRRPFALGRGMQCRDEAWRPDPRCVRVIRGGGRETPSGFVVLGQVLVRPGHAGYEPPREGDTLTVTDGWAADVLAAAALLRTVAEEGRDARFEWLRLNCPGDDPLVRAAVLAGGQMRAWAAQERDHTDAGEDVDAFYLADLRLAVEQLLPELDARWRAFDGDAPQTLALGMEEQTVALGLGSELRLLDAAPADAPTVRLPRKAMTQALMGYATPTELSVVHPACAIRPACRVAADALLVARKPHLDHEETAFGGPSRYGLVP